MMATLQQPVATGVAWETAVDLSDKDVIKRLSPAAIKGFLRIAELWDLRDEDARQLLGGISNGGYYELKKGARKTLDQDRLTRVSLLTGIFKALNILYSKKLADQWIRLPNANPIFGGDPPLGYLIRGGVPAMLRVRQLLDARRGGR
jgi:RES domain-containing protein